MRSVRPPVRDTRSVRQRSRDRRREVETPAAERPVLQLPLRLPVAPNVGIDGPIRDEGDHDRPRSEPSDAPKSDRGVAVVDFYI